MAGAALAALSSACQGTVGGARTTALIDAESPPDASEIAWLVRASDAVFARARQWPHPIDEAFASLGAWRSYSIDCPAAAPLDRVDIRLRTRFSRWRDQVTVNGRLQQVPPQNAGYYLWAPVLAVRGRQMQVEADNLVMFSPDRHRGADANQIERDLFDFGLVYHELLHAQLLIDWFGSDDGRTELCNGRFDLDQADPAHRAIYPLLRRFADALAAEHADIIGVRLHASDAAGLVHVEVPLPRSNSPVRRSGIWLFEFSNLTPDASRMDLAAGRVHFDSRLADPGQDGFVIVVPAN